MAESLRSPAPSKTTRERPAERLIADSKWQIADSRSDDHLTSAICNKPPAIS